MNKILSVFSIALCYSLIITVSFELSEQNYSEILA